MSFTRTFQMEQGSLSFTVIFIHFLFSVTFLTESLKLYNYINYNLYNHNHKFPNYLKINYIHY